MCFVRGQSALVVQEVLSDQIYKDGHIHDILKGKLTVTKEPLFTDCINDYTHILQDVRIDGLSCKVQVLKLRHTHTPGL